MLESPPPERAEQTPEKRRPKRGFGTETRPPSDWTRPHGAPRPTAFPARSASPTSSSAPSAPILNRRTSAAAGRPAPPELRRNRPGHPVKQGRCGIDHSASILPLLVSVSNGPLERKNPRGLDYHDPPFPRLIPATGNRASGSPCPRRFAIPLYFAPLTPHQFRIALENEMDVGNERALL